MYLKNNDDKDVTLLCNMQKRAYVLKKISNINIYYKKIKQFSSVVSAFL